MTRYYAVGAPVQDYEGSFLKGIRKRVIQQDELEAQSFFIQDTIRLFRSVDEAREYAYGLRHAANEFGNIKLPLSRSKIRPVFSVELEDEFELGELQKEKFKYEEHYVDDHHTSKTRRKRLNLSFFEVKSNLIHANNVIRAEFFPVLPNERQMPAVEFEHGEKSHRCIIC